MNNTRFVGYASSSSTPTFANLFKDEVVDFISDQVTLTLDGLDPSGRRIIVPRRTIGLVISSITSEWTPPTGDVHSKYTVAQNPINWQDEVIKMCIQRIVRDVSNNIQQQTRFNGTSKWNTVYGNFNPEGLQAHSKITVLERRPTSGMIAMRY